jgi:hypothetical protein
MQEGRIVPPNKLGRISSSFEIAAGSALASNFTRSRKVIGSVGILQSAWKNASGYIAASI